MQKADLTNLPFDEKTFDAVLCYHVLEHIEDDKKSISEIYRVLKQGGWAILQTTFERDRAKTFEDLNIKSREERKKLFGQEDRFVDIFNEIEKKRLALDEDETIIFCKKPH